MSKQTKVAGVFSVMMLAFATLTANNRKPNDCTGPVLCSSLPLPGECEGCFCPWQVDIGLLYQRPAFSYMNSGFAYSPVYQNPTTTSSTAFENQTVQLLDEEYEYAVGLTVGLGRALRHDNWFVGVNFGWINSTASTTHEDENILYRPSSEFAINSFIRSGFTIQTAHFQKVIFAANTDIYDFNVHLSRGAYLTNHYSFEPFAGVHALWFNNTQTKNYEDPSTDTTSRFILNSTQDNWGVGPMLGLNGQYYFTKNVSLFANSSVSVLYGEARYKVVTTVTPNSAGSNVFTDSRVTTNPGKMLNVCSVPVRAIIGMKLAKYVMEGSHYIALKVGYDARAVLSASSESILSQMYSINADSITTVQAKNIDNGFTMSGLYLDFMWSF
ncbi:MAG: hypothetical protein SP4CHLAM5_11740 [Chlamydiia bacterium]|nr:hypothetical protein [Chlamydiia bacterium]